MWYITTLRITNVEVINSRAFGLVGRFCNGVRITGCYIHRTNADGCAFWDTNDIVVDANKFEDCDDDCISLHTNDSTASPLRMGIVVTNNVISSSQGIKVLGAKNLVISGNTIRRCYSYGVFVNSDVFFNQGDTPHHSISITNNVINDIFLRVQGGNTEQYYIRIGGGQQNAGSGAAPPGRNNTATGAIVSLYGTLLGNFQANNTDDTSVASPGGYFITIKDNVLARTLPAVSAYADWGFGTLWAGNGFAGGIYSGPVPEANLNTNGIVVEPFINNAIIEGNTINTSGDKAIFFKVGAAPAVLSFDNFTVRNNKISNFKSYGVFWEGNTLSSQGINLAGNEFDGDPLFTSTNRGTNGTWVANTVPSAVYVPFVSGLKIDGNDFKNVARATTTSTGINNFFGNTVRADPAVAGFSTSNKGIGNAPKSGLEFKYVIEDCDPTSATYGQILNQTVNDSTAVPTSGKYVEGHVVQNTNPTIAGTRNRFVYGWKRLTTGTAHVLGTDWAEVGVTSTALPGATNTESGSFAIIAGGNNNTASGLNSGVLGGNTNVASGAYSVVSGGQSNTASQSHSYIPGGAFATTNNRQNSWAYGNIGFATAGRGQNGGQLTVATVTNTASAVELSSNNTSPATSTTSFALQNSSAVEVLYKVIARDTTTGDTKTWSVQGTVKRGANAATTALVGSAVVTVLQADTAAINWSIALTANTTVGGPSLAATILSTISGALANTVRVVARLESVEVA
jgi:Right handed beta helix region